MNVNLQSNICQPDRLESFLSGELSDEQELKFATHLDECATCRQRLERQAAEPDDWNEAEQLLKPTPFDGTDATKDFELLRHSQTEPLLIQSVLDALAPTDDPDMLGRLGGYEVSGVVGSGGMGVVLKAVDKSLDRAVAIKVMSPHLAMSGAARKRFAREAKAAAAVLHPNVIAIHSVSNDESLPYLVMPYIRGTALQKRLDAEGPLGLQEILRIGSQVAAGLSAAHAQGLVHRDIKPANILLEDGIERVAITDFGLARAVDDASITRSGVIAGTPQYMSPEQARGESIDQRSDLFSLGSVLYALCTGRPPFRAETTFGVMRRISDDEPTAIRQINTDIPEWLCQIIHKLMSKDASDRFASAEEVQVLLEQCLAHVQQPETVPLPESLVTPSKPPRKIGIRTAIASMGIGLLAFLTWQMTSPPDIFGSWTGDGWGQVTLKQIKSGKYEGTYTDTYGPKDGTIELKWSLVDQAFRGTWGEGDRRSGKISVELVDDQIRGHWMASKRSEINPGEPELETLVWMRGTSPPRKEYHRNSLKEFERLIEQRQYADAASLALSAQKLTRDETLQKTWELRSKFARQLDTAKAERTDEHELRELLKFPLQRITDSETPHVVSPPTFTDVLHELEQSKGLAEGRLTALFEKHPDNINIVIEAIYDKVDPPRHFPLIGTARLHRVRFKCAVYFTETDELKWPLPHEEQQQIVESFYIDLDHLHIHDFERDDSELSNAAHLLKPDNQEPTPKDAAIVWDPLEVVVNQVSAKNRDLRQFRGGLEIVTLGENSLLRKNGIEVGDILVGLDKWETTSTQNLVWILSQPVVNAGKSKTYSVKAHILRNGEILHTLVTLPVPDDLRPERDDPYAVEAPQTEILTATELLKQADGLQASRKRVIVRFQVDAVRLNEFKSPDGSTYSQWELLLTETPQFTVRFSAEAQKELKARGVEEISNAFKGKILELRGFVEGTSRDVPGLPTKSWTYHMDVKSLDRIRFLDPDAFPRPISIPVDESLRFSEPQEIVLSIDSSQFMLDLDTGQTMDPPQTHRPEQEHMDVHPGWISGDNLPQGLVGLSLRGLKVKPSSWDATPGHLQQCIGWDGEQPLLQMHFDPEEPATYFFKTQSGTVGILQLQERTQDPSGIRVRYKRLTPNPVTKTPTVSIQGIVRNPNRQPLQHIEVRIYESLTYSERLIAAGESDANGQFEFEGLSQTKYDRQKYKLVVVAPNFASFVAALGDFQVGNERYEVVLSDPSRLRGRVVGPDLQPIVGAEIYTPWMNEFVPGIQSAKTDRNGYFQISDLTPWESTTEQESSDRSLLLRVFHPDFGFALVPYREVPAEVSVMFEKPTIVTGRVVYEGTDNPVSGARVSGGNRVVTTDREGRYRFAVQSRLTGGIDIELLDDNDEQIIRPLELKTVPNLKIEAPDLEMPRSVAEQAIPTEEKSLTLSFKNAPYADVIELLAKQLELPVQFDATPSGTFSYKDKQSLPVSRVLEILNDDLARRGLTIVREPGRLLVTEIPSPDPTLQQLQGEWEYLSYESDGIVKHYKPGTATLSIVEDRWTVGPGLGERFSHRVEIDGNQLTFHGKTSTGSKSGYGGDEPSLAYGLFKLTGDSLIYSLSPFSPEADVLENNVITAPRDFQTKGTEYTLYRLSRKTHSEQAEPAGDAQPDDFPHSTHHIPKRLHHIQTDSNITTVAISPDGKRIAVANGNPTRTLQTDGHSRVKDDWKPTVQIFDSESGESVVSLDLTEPEEDTILAATPRISHLEATALAFSPDGDFVAVGTSIGQVKLFDAEDGSLVRTFDDEAARLADKETPDNWKPLVRGMGSVTSLAISPRCTRLAVSGESFTDFSDVFDGIRSLGRTGTGPGRLKVWNIRNGDLLHDLVGHSHANAVAFSPDTKSLASAGRWSNERSDGSGVILWDLETGEKVRSITNTENGGTRSIAFSPDSKLLAIACQSFDKDEDTSAGILSLVHCKTGIMEWKGWVKGWAKPVAFTPDGQQVVALCDGKTIEFSDVETKTVNHLLQAKDSPHGSRWNDIAVATHGNFFVIGGVDDERNGSVEIWKLDTPTETYQIPEQ